MSHNSSVRRGVVVRIEKAFRMFDIDPVVGNFQRHLDRVCPRCFKAVMQIIRNSPEKDLQPFFLRPLSCPVPVMSSHSRPVRIRLELPCRRPGAYYIRRQARTEVG